jgi:hypothetical protein
VRVGQVNTEPVTLQWTRPPCPQSSVVHAYTGGPRGKKDNEASHINDGSNPLSVFLLYFAEVIALLVAETNRYYHDNADLTKDPLLNLTLLKPKCLFLALTRPMSHCVRDRLLGNSGPVLHTFLRHYDETGPTSSHP